MDFQIETENNTELPIWEVKFARNDVLFEWQADFQAILEKHKEKHQEINKTVLRKTSISATQAAPLPRLIRAATNPKSLSRNKDKDKDKDNKEKDETLVKEGEKETPKIGSAFLATLLTTGK